MSHTARDSRFLSALARAHVQACDDEAVESLAKDFLGADGIETN
jgi:hypothetical protein